MAHRTGPDKPQDGSETREEADHKLMRQQKMGEKLRRRGRTRAVEAQPRDSQEKLDQALKETFPGSDPVSLVQAAPPPKSAKDARDRHRKA